MDTFERRFAASLKEVAHRVPDELPAQKASSPLVGPRHRFTVPLLAAAAVTAILGVAVWQTNLSQTPLEAAPAEPGGVFPSQTANLAPSGARNDVVERLEPYRDDVGFGAIVLDRGSNSVTVLWDGTPPSSLREMEGTQPNGVELNLAEAAY